MPIGLRLEKNRVKVTNILENPVLCWRPGHVRLLFLEKGGMLKKLT
jgi:hypothetical protein